MVTPHSTPSFYIFRSSAFMRVLFGLAFSLVRRYVAAIEPRPHWRKRWNERCSREREAA